MKLSEYIYGYRKNNHLSLRTFAEKCGVSYQYINKLEKNEIEKPSLQFLIRIANGMGLTTEELLTVVDDFTIDFAGDSPYLAGKSDLVNKIVSKMNQLTAEELSLVDVYIDTIMKIYHQQ